MSWRYYWELLLFCHILLVFLHVDVVLSIPFSGVNVFHLIDNEKWGETDGSAIQGKIDCPTRCEFISSDCQSSLPTCLRRKLEDIIKAGGLPDDQIFGLMYHIHTWGTFSKWPHGPNYCEFPAHYAVVESEESQGRFKRLFSASFPQYDGNSTTHPSSTIRRFYVSPSISFTSDTALRPFTSLIKGASFVASTCHRVEGTTKRVSVVKEMQGNGFRVDSLGKCHTTRNIPEGIHLRMGKTAQESLQLKKEAISNYMFYCAFENTYEPGYVTEKVFDAIEAGVVPIYLGSSVDCKELLPHPRAAIFLDDFNNNVTALVQYLRHLVKNETAYEWHRSSWRRAEGNSLSQSPLHHLLAKSWPCRVCEWLHTQATRDSQRTFEKRNQDPRTIRLNTFKARHQRFRRYAENLIKNGTCK